MYENLCSKSVGRVEPLPSRAQSQTACDVTRKGKRQNLFTFLESIKYGVLIILIEN
jgi:hypothetical protein